MPNGCGWPAARKKGKRERYPWDVPGSGRVTDAESEVTQRGNPGGGLTPMNPASTGRRLWQCTPWGESEPCGLWDVAGNVWEWTGSWYDKGQTGRVLHGGSWSDSRDYARPAVRDGYDPGSSYDDVGFRLVSPIDSGF